ncbi:MAG: EpsG family protein [archaeon]|nr:EpsG family protein [archaeon]
MLIYLILFGGIFGCALVDFVRPFNEKSRKELVVIWCVIFVLFKGLRWDTGSDWGQYYTCFEESSWSNIFSYWRYGYGSEKMEFGYVFINVLIKTILPHYSVFLIVTNAFIMYCVAKIILKYVPQRALVGLLMAMVSLELFPVRQSLAIAFFIYSIPYILDGKLKQFLLLMLLSFTLHRASILQIPFYWILRSNFSYKRNIIIYLFVILIPNVFYDVFSVLQNSFLNTLLGNGLRRYNAVDVRFLMEFEGTQTSLAGYINSILQLSLFSFVLSKQQRSLSDRDTKPMNLCLNMYFVFLCLVSIASHPGFDSLYRIANVFIFGYALSVCYCVYYFKGKKHHLIAIALLMGMFAIKYNSLPIHENLNGLFVPYKSFLSQDYATRSPIWFYHQH